MTRFFVGSALATALAITAVCLVPVRVFTQQEGTPAQGDRANAASAAKAMPTPKTADGHPDLSGMWNGGRGGGGGIKPDAKGNLTLLAPTRKCTPGQTDCAPGVNVERDSTFTARMNPNRPLYKPEFWDKVQYLDDNSNKEDPTFACALAGIPRVGAPQKIVQTAKEAIFFYPQGGAASAPDSYRIIPIDGRPHDPIRSLDTTFYGDSVGHWEGETLVIDSVGFNDLTWLAAGGYFHSNNMHVIERFRREGNTLTWQATVDDPDVLQKPWTMNARTVFLNTNPNASFAEGLPCDERDQAHMVTKEHH